MIKLARALAILRQVEESVPLYKVAKKGIAKKVVKALGGTLKGFGEAGEKALTEAGLPGAGKVMRYAPHAALAYGGYKASKSQPVEKLKYKIRVFRARRAMKKARRQQQRGYR